MHDIDTLIKPLQQIHYLNLCVKPFWSKETSDCAQVEIKISLL